MFTLTPKAAKMIAKRLKRVLEQDFGEDVRLGHCQEAIAEAFDFDHASEMFRRLPELRTWRGEWCVNHLADEALVRDPSVAAEAVARLESRFGGLLADP